MIPLHLAFLNRPDLFNCHRDLMTLPLNKLNERYSINVLSRNTDKYKSPLNVANYLEYVDEFHHSVAVPKLEGEMLMLHFGTNCQHWQWQRIMSRSIYNIDYTLSLDAPAKYSVLFITKDGKVAWLAKSSNVFKLLETSRLAHTLSPLIPNLKIFNSLPDFFELGRYSAPSAVPSVAATNYDLLMA